MRALIRPFLIALCLTPMLPLPLAAQSMVALKIATIPADSGMEAYYARDNGFFANAGINADVESIQSGSTVVAGVMSGNVDIGFSNLLPVAQANARGIPLVILFPGDMHLTAKPNGALMVTKDSPINTGRDFNGKTIAIPTLQNMTQLGPMAWVDQNGGDSKTLHFVEIPRPSLGAALDAHRVDAIFATEPFLTAFKRNDRVVTDALDSISTRFVTNCWFTTKAWADAHPDAVARFVTAIRTAAHWANTNPAESIPLIARYTQTSEDVVTRMPRLDFEETIVPKDFQPLMDVALKYGMLARAVTAVDIISPAAIAAAKVK